MKELLPGYFDDLEIRVTLSHIEPAIWRTLRVPADTPLGILHVVLQTAFGWEDQHLYGFRVGKLRFGPTNPADMMFSISDLAAPLGALVSEKTIFYDYDYGDGWEHEIQFLKVVAGPVGSTGTNITCTGGARACPPEDCGGPPGYDDLLEALRNPKDERHAEMKEWVGRKFDPDRFDAVAVDKKLRALAKKLRARGRR